MRIHDFTKIRLVCLHCNLLNIFRKFLFTIIVNAHWLLPLFRHSKMRNSVRNDGRSFKSGRLLLWKRHARSQHVKYVFRINMNSSSKYDRWKIIEYRLWFRKLQNVLFILLSTSSSSCVSCMHRLYLNTFILFPLFDKPRLTIPQVPIPKEHSDSRFR